MNPSEHEIVLDGAEGRRSRLYSQVRQAVFDTPWAVLPATMSVIVEAVTLRLEGGRLSAEEIEQRIGAGPAPRPSGTLAGGIAVIPLYGVLMPRATLMSQISGGTSLQEFGQVFRQALASDSVGAIVLDIDSPGGSTAMTPETAALIRSASKPVVAIANTLCCSGAYWLASQADELVAGPSALLGSVGVYGVHEDMSALEEKLGIKTTLISAGKYKVEGNEHEPLTAEGAGAMQALVDEFYGMFTGDVAKGRGVPVANVRDGFGEGRVVTAKQAVSEGMADRVGTLEQTIARVARGAAPSRATAAGRERITLSTDSGGIIQMYAGAVKPHSTDVIDEPWDGPAEEAKLDSPVTGPLGTGMYAWFDSNGDDPDGDGYPDAKADWKFPHHRVTDGKPNAANLDGVRNALSRLTDAKIPDGDRAGVKAHLQAHLDDYEDAQDNGSDETTEKSLADQVGETAGPVTPARADLNKAALGLLSRPGFRRAYTRTKEEA
jgi:signal peptide peptidase SppA